MSAAPGLCGRDHHNARSRWPLADHFAGRIRGGLAAKKYEAYQQLALRRLGEEIAVNWPD